MARDITWFYGVNHDKMTTGSSIVPTASETTKCLWPVAKVLHASGVGIYARHDDPNHSFLPQRTSPLLDR